jgi:SAM-dependent methyltransferase
MTSEPKPGRFQRHFFRPSWLSLVANPYHTARKQLYLGITEAGLELRGRMLDVGCGSKPYRGAFPGISDYVGLELDSPEARANATADHYYDGVRFPFEDDVFDVVFCSQVLEHVFEPVSFISEMHRVARSGGMLLLTVPLLWDEHEKPRDYGRYTSHGIRHLLERGGFTVVQQAKLTGGAAALVQLASATAYSRVSRALGRPGRLLLSPFLTLPLNLLGELLALRRPHDPDLYLDNLVLATVNHVG